MPATVTPAGVQGRKIDNGEFYGMTIAMAPVDSLSSSTKNSGGSHIEIRAAGNPRTVDENTFGGTETAPAEAVTQKAELAEPTKETAKAEPTASTHPQTGDESAQTAGLIAAVAAGVAALAAELRLRLFRK